MLRRVTELYIPLCLYFNRRRICWTSSWNTFTFHYVSILIFITMTRKSVKTDFTFHYVSILMNAVRLSDRPF